MERRLGVYLLSVLCLSLLLCAAATSGWAAPTIEMYAVKHTTLTRSYLPGGEPIPRWAVAVGMCMKDSAGVENISGVTVWDPAGEPLPNENVHWPWIGSSECNACICLMWEFPSQPPLGSYTLQAYGEDGSESAVVVTVPFDHFPTPVPEITYPAPGSVILEAAPEFSWPAYPGFACEGGAAADSQHVDLSTPDEAVWLWYQEVPVEATSVLYDGPPLEPGHDYTFHLWETGPWTLVEPVPWGWYGEETRADSAFAVYSPVPAIDSAWLDRGPSMSPEGEVTYFEEGEAAVRDADGLDDIASVTLTRVAGDDVQVYEGVRTNPEETEVARFRWSLWGQPTAPPPATYTLTVTDLEGNTSSVWRQTSEITLPPPVITEPDPGSSVASAAPTFAWTAPEGAGCFCMGISELDGPCALWCPNRWPSPSVTPPVDYSYDGTGADLLPGHEYRWYVNYHVADPAPGDERFTARFRPTADGRFIVASLDPTILTAGVCRGRFIGVDGGEWFHESGNAPVTDTDGLTDADGQPHLSVVTQGPGPYDHPGLRDTDFSSVEGIYRLRHRWCGGSASPIAEGPYTVLATDTAGNSASLTTPDAVALPAVQEIAYPQNGEVIPETDITPTFTWQETPGADQVCVCVQTPSNETLWVKQGLPAGTTSVTYNDDYTATAPTLMPGLTYQVHVRAVYPSAIEDNGTSIGYFTGRTTEFTLYSPVPVIEFLLLSRGRDVSPEGVVSYHERVMAHVSDMDGDVVSVVVTDPLGTAHEAEFQDAGWYNWRWAIYDEEAPSPEGAYLLTVTDQEGNVAALSVQGSAIPEESPVILTPPANSSITSAPPTFSWSGPGDICYCLGVREAGYGVCALWCGGRYVEGTEGSAVYNDDGSAAQPELTPGPLWEWFIAGAMADPVEQSDPRCVSEFNSMATGRFWVEPKFVGPLQPINSDGSSIFKLNSTVPVKFQLLNADGSYKSDATATLSVAKVEDDVLGEHMEAASTAPPDSGNSFRYDATANQYVFNLGTRGMSVGTWSLRVTVDGVVAKEVLISLE